MLLRIFLIPICLISTLAHAEGMTYDYDNIWYMYESYLVPNGRFHGKKILHTHHLDGTEVSDTCEIKFDIREEKPEFFTVSEIRMHCTKSGHLTRPPLALKVQAHGNLFANIFIGDEHVGVSTDMKFTFGKKIQATPETPALNYLRIARGDKKPFCPFTMGYFVPREDGKLEYHTFIGALSFSKF